jgi:Xaa-Pro aminopeptidase
VQEAAKQIRPGSTESDTKKLVQEIQSMLGSAKSWHPPQIRFGTNSTLSFGKKGVENNALQANDIYFLDIGPIFEEHEGDVGRTFVLGSDPEMQRCCSDVEEIWHEVRQHWENTKANGKELYSFAEERAKKRGWVLSLESANGHRIADFPHAAKARGSIEEFPQKPAPDRWILEIQIRHPNRPFGAFFEDILH